MQYIKEINDYWSGHAENFTNIIKDELTTEKYDIWLHEIIDNIPEGENLSVLDVGCGPGFFSILFARLGHQVTGIDYNENMLIAARNNAKSYMVSDRIRFTEMDAQNLCFEDSTFDIVVSRNLTWTLEKPEYAYKEWLRVLKSGGRLLNFDANWDTYLHDKNEEYEHNKILNEIRNQNIDSKYGTPQGNDRYTEIRGNLPLSKERRPLWDFKTLYELGCKSITVKPKLEGKLYDEFYEALYVNTPTFTICAVK